MIHFSCYANFCIQFCMFSISVCFRALAGDQRTQMMDFETSPGLQGQNLAERLNGQNLAECAVCHQVKSQKYYFFPCYKLLFCRWFPKDVSTTAASPAIPAELSLGWWNLLINYFATWEWKVFRNKDKKCECIST